MKKKVLTIGDPALRGQCHKVVNFADLRLPLFLRDMAETMYKENGVGLAAPQIGIKRRMVVVDVGDGLMEFINPDIVRAEGESLDVEGCLSVPGRRGKVLRAEKITVRAQDRAGRPFEMEADGLLARCLQHEIDHLNGVLYVDKMVEEVFEEDKD